VHSNQLNDLDELRAKFLATSTVSMPIAGILFWFCSLVASRLLTAHQLALFVGFGSGSLFPLGLLIDRMRGRTEMADPNSPITVMFLQSLGSIVMMWPLIIFAGSVAPALVVLGGAVLMGLVWIPYGWAANDPTGLRHAIARTVGCYVAFLFFPVSWRLTAICAVPLVCYGYSLVTMKRPNPKPKPA
jgi:hypothetical protein